MKHTIDQIDDGQLDAMYNMLRIGHQKSNIPVLKEYCGRLRQAMIQKDAGQRRNTPKGSVDFSDLGTIINIIVIETMCLYLSGDLDMLEKLKGEHECTTEA